jgi:hypothetical protein
MLAKMDKSQRIHSRPYAQALVTTELFTMHQLFWPNALTKPFNMLVFTFELVTSTERF